MRFFSPGRQWDGLAKTAAPYDSRRTRPANAYLQAGLPIIVNDYTNLAERVKRAGCGEVVEHPDQIGAALRDMSNSLDVYPGRAVDHHNQHLCVDGRVQEVVDYILALTPAAGT